MEGVDFDDWYREERPRVLASITAITGRPSIAGELTDEAFTRAVARWRRVRVMDSPGGWVHRTALNLARRRLRRDRQESRLLRTVAAGASSEAAPPTWPLDLWDALRALPPRQREAMVLRHVADLTVADVAEAMGVAPGTVSATLHAARGQLARRWPDMPDTEHNANTPDHRPPADLPVDEDAPDPATRTT